MINLKDVYLHDAYISGLEIKTVNDHFDYIAINLESSEFKDEYGTDKIKVVFEGCYKAKLNLQMWISGTDSIRNCYYKEESDWLKDVQTLHYRGLLPKSKEFKHIIFELNTSGSVIEILASYIKIESL